MSQILRKWKGSRQEAAEELSLVLNPQRKIKVASYGFLPRTQGGLHGKHIYILPDIIYTTLSVSHFFMAL